MALRVPFAHGPGATARRSRRRLSRRSRRMFRRAPIRRLRAAPLIALAALAVAAPAAHGHAAFLGATPAPGGRVETAPTTITLRFTDTLNRRLSEAHLVDVGSDRRVPAAQHAAGSDGLVLAPVTALSRGTYRVEWHTVSTTDGHELQGSFGFGLRVAAAGGGRAVEQSPLADLGWVRALVRALLYATLLSFAGALLLAALLGRPWLVPTSLEPAARAGLDAAAARRRTRSLVPDLGLFGAAAVDLGAPSELWQTPYGRVLRVKSALVGAIAAASYGHAQRLRPRLLAANPHPPAALERRHWRLVGAEPLLALGVFAAVGVLVAFPLPPRQLEDATNGSRAAVPPCSPCPLPAPAADELSVAAQGGSTVVATWIRRSGGGTTGTVRLLDYRGNPAIGPARIAGARQSGCGPGCILF